MCTIYFGDSKREKFDMILTKQTIYYKMPYLLTKKNNIVLLKIFKEANKKLFI